MERTAVNATVTFNLEELRVQMRKCLNNSLLTMDGYEASEGRHWDKPVAGTIQLEGSNTPQDFTLGTVSVVAGDSYAILEIMVNDQVDDPTFFVICLRYYHDPEPQVASVWQVQDYGSIVFDPKQLTYRINTLGS